MLIIFAKFIFNFKYNIPEIVEINLSLSKMYHVDKLKCKI